jgi:hypothetical protein
MTMTRRHPSLLRMYDMAIFIGEFWDSALYPSVLLLSIKTCYSSRQFARVAFLAASSVALGLCPILCYVVGGRGVSEFLSFVFFTIPLYTFFVLTETCLERHKSFVFRLSRTAVLYVIYHGLGGYPPNNGTGLTLKLPYPHPTTFEISRVTHPSCLSRDCYWSLFQTTGQPSQDLPPSSLACAHSKRECVPNA